MAIRVRKDGTMWCAALTDEQPDDTYVDDGLHYELSVERGVIVALPWPDHKTNPQWWWVGQAPNNADFSMVKI